MAALNLRPRLDQNGIMKTPSSTRAGQTPTSSKPASPDFEVEQMEGFYELGMHRQTLPPPATSSRGPNSVWTSSRERFSWFSPPLGSSSLGFQG